MTTLVRSACSVVVLASFVSCADTTAPPEPCLDDTGVALAVQTGGEPRITWHPACLAFRLGVSDSLGAIVWQIDADSGNTLTSGVTYGVVPDQTSEVVPAVTLTSGHRYAVGLFRATTDTVPYGASLLAAIAFRR